MPIPPSTPRSCNFRTAAKTVKLCRRLPNIASHCRRVESADGHEIESRRVRRKQARKRQAVRRLPRLSPEPLFEFSPKIQARGVAACAADCRGRFGQSAGHHPSAQSLTITNPRCQRADFGRRTLVRDVPRGAFPLVEVNGKARLPRARPPHLNPWCKDGGLRALRRIVPPPSNPRPSVRAGSART
jgi:hypothetical protein